MKIKRNFYGYENESINQLFLEFSYKEKYLRWRNSFFLIFSFLFMTKDDFKTFKGIISHLSLMTDIDQFMFAKN